MCEDCEKVLIAGKEVELRKKIKLPAREIGSLPSLAVRLILDHLSTCRVTMKGDSVGLPPIPVVAAIEVIHFHAVEGDFGDYKGRLPKRISKWYFEAWKIKLDAEIVTAIGNFVALYADKSPEFVVDFTDRFDWNAGDFGDKGSCFWGGRQSDREWLEDHGFLAVRTWHDDGSGTGRAWIAPMSPTAIILFNSYGNAIERLSVALAHLFKGRLKRVDFGTEDGTWINNDAGWMIETNPDGAMDHNQFFGDRANLRQICCHACEEWFAEEDDGYHYDDDWYCDNCYSETFSTCDYCGDTCYTEYAHSAYGRSGQEMSICEDCGSRHFTACADCGDYHHDDTVLHIAHTAMYVCQYCFDHDEGYATCDDCGDYVNEFSVIETTGDLCCPSCLKEREQTRTLWHFAAEFNHTFKASPLAA